MRNTAHAATDGSNEFSRGWTVLLAGLLGVAFGASPIPYNVIGFTAEPISAELGWSQTEILLPITIFGVIASLLAPVFGSAADRYGVRPVALWSLALFGVSFAAIALTPSTDSPATLYTYYALWVLVGLVGIGSTPVTWSRAVNLWFFRHRGLALGILLLGTSVAAMIVPRIAVWAIETYGWREMFAIVALLPLVIALPIAWFLFREPRPEERPKAVSGAGGRLTGVSLGAAMRDYRFWLIWASIAFIATAFGGAFINMPRILSLKGIDAQTAASVMGILGIGILIGRLVTGALLDRFWQGFVAFPLLCLPAISAWILLGDNVTFPLAAIAGFLLGFAAGAESDLIAYLAGRYFGMLNYGRIYGMLYMPFGLFSALSPILYAQTFDRTGSFDPMLVLAMGGFVIGGALLLFVGAYPETLPEEPDQAPQVALTGAA